jgi:hypothetical protein
VTWLAGVVLVLTLLVTLELLAGSRLIQDLRDLPPVDGGAVPAVSVVVAARDEARAIEGAIRSMLRQDYPAYQVVVVDDRSGDGTGAILDRLAAEDSRLTVVHLTDLPDGWLGKNHALHVGAARATGEFILFTDADIHLAPDTLRRAVGYCRTHGVDHLAVAPDIIMPGPLMEAFAVLFTFSFLSFAKPWKARDPKSWFFVGVGAFNLVRAAAYRAVGGHERLRLRPDDDLKLGKVLKRSGARQDVAGGRGMVRVEWYHSLGEMIRGLEKNMFAGVEYSVLLSIGGGLFQLLLGVVPLIALFVTTGPARLLFGAQVACGLGAMAFVAYGTGARLRTVLLSPAVSLLFVFILWRTMILNLSQGGIRWRGTFYSLRQLKANRV